MWLQISGRGVCIENRDVEGSGLIKSLSLETRSGVLARLALPPRNPPPARAHVEERAENELGSHSAWPLPSQLESS